MSRRHKVFLLKTLLCIACCAALSIPAAFWYRRPPLRVRVSDPTFHVLSARVLRSPNDSFYMGNQFEGQARAFLHDRCHLKVKPLFDVSSVAFSTVSADGGSTFALCYSPKPYPSPVPLDIQLLDSSGVSVGVSTAAIFGSNPCCCLLVNLDKGRTNAGDYTLTIKRLGASVAKVDINGLPPVKPFHIGPNAF